MLTFLTLLTMGMVLTLAMLMARDDEPRRAVARRVQSGVRIRVTR